jgi:hypothetical protein
VQASAQLGVAAVDLVAGHPCRRDTGIQREGDQLARERRLGGEPDMIGKPGGMAPVRIRTISDAVVLVSAGTPCD